MKNPFRKTQKKITDYEEKDYSYVPSWIIYLIGCISFLLYANSTTRSNMWYIDISEELIHKIDNLAFYGFGVFCVAMASFFGVVVQRDKIKKLEEEIKKLKGDKT